VTYKGEVADEDFKFISSMLNIKRKMVKIENDDLLG